MDFAYLRRPTLAAADEVETGRLRRFPDLPLPPPPHGDANASPVDAALARRREELLWELHKARIHQSTILRELVETEFAMGFTAAGHNPAPALPSSQDYWRCRTPAAPPMEEEPPLRTPRPSTEHPHCGCRGPAAVRAPPVYPRVEWSPAPVVQPRPVSDTEKQQDWRSSGARTHHSFDDNVELCRSSEKPTLVQEASVPQAAIAGTQPMPHEVTTGHNDAAGGRHKDDVKDGHNGHQLYESGSQSNGQRKIAETTQVDEINGATQRLGQYRMADQENAALDQQKEREFIVPRPEQQQLSNGAEKQKESPGAGAGAGAQLFNGNAELCLSPSKQSPVEKTLVPVAAKAEEAASGHPQAFDGKPKADVEDGHGVQPLGEISSGQSKDAQSAMEGRSDNPAQLPGQNGVAQNAAYNEQKQVEFSESGVPIPWTLNELPRASAGAKRNLSEASPPPAKKPKKPLGENSCAICRVNTPSPRNLEEHLAGKMHRWNVAAAARAG